MPLFADISVWCRMVKIQHSVFALPFAFMGAFAAARGLPPLWPLAYLTIAMVCIRSFAMTVNRIVDLRYDRVNPRTANRPLVTGEISVSRAWLFAAFTAAVFMAAAGALNNLCLALSPGALALAAGYSWTKRFTPLCHFILGSVLGLAPIAGWLAISPSFELPPVLIGFGVLFWTAGFDMLYALQDVAFDKQHSLHSIPALHGIPAALSFVAFCHANAVIFLLAGGWALRLAWHWHATCALVAVILYVESRLVAPEDLSRLNIAFFAMNGMVSLLLLAGMLTAIYLGG